MNQNPHRLRHAMSTRTMDHRLPDFGELLAPLLGDLKKVFKTTAGQVFTFPASGTGGWEAAITNTLSPGDKVLAAPRHVLATLDRSVPPVPPATAARYVGNPANCPDPFLGRCHAHQYTGWWRHP